MDIDLSKVIGYSRNSLQSRALMRSIILDLYPGKTREMNVLLDVYESGVPRKIKNDGSINDAQYAQYVQKIISEYGLQEALILDALDAWIDVCLGKGYATRIHYIRKDEQAKSQSNIQPSVQHQYHQPPTQPAFPVRGNQNDYEIITISSNSIEISKFIGFDEAKTIIPNEINGKKVAGIGKAAYKNCKGIRDLIISDGIEYIEAEAFNDCDNIRTIAFPSTLKRIGQFSFSSTGVEHLDLPNGVKIIESAAFYWCRKLTTVILPDYLEEIGNQAFAYDWVLTSVRMPRSVKKIGSSAFEECTALSCVELNEGLIEIGGNAFKKCTSLSKITIPYSVITFGERIFEGRSRWDPLKVVASCYKGSKAIEYLRNNNITINDISVPNAGGSQSRKVSIPEPIQHKPIVNAAPAIRNTKNDYEIKNISATTVEISKYVGFDEARTIIPSEVEGKKVVGVGRAAYKNCKGIQELIISHGIEYIEAEAFSDCENIRTIAFPSTLKRIGQSSFRSTGIEHLDLPNGVKIIESEAFYWCRNLTTVILPDYLEEIGNRAFEYDQVLTSVRMPTSVKKIGSSAFEECIALSSVELNEGLTEIGENAFKRCSSLKKITIPRSVVTFGPGIFDGRSRWDPLNVVIYCYPRSRAIEYARNSKLRIENAQV